MVPPPREKERLGQTLSQEMRAARAGPPLSRGCNLPASPARWSLPPAALRRSARDPIQLGQLHPHHPPAPGRKGPPRAVPAPGQDPRVGASRRRICREEQRWKVEGVGGRGFAGSNRSATPRRRTSEAAVSHAHGRAQQSESQRGPWPEWRRRAAPGPRGRPRQAASWGRALAQTRVEFVGRGAAGLSFEVGIRGTDIVVLGVEKKSVAKLQDERTVRKICALDDHVCMAFAGLTADARVVINRARVECQSHKLTVEDPVTVEYITRFIATLKQRYTQSNGRRPFGISALIVGFDDDGIPRLYQTDPSGTYHAWKANAIGRSAKTVREFLEKNYTEDAIANDNEAIKLAIRALLEVVQSGGKNIELAIIRRNQPLKMFSAKEIELQVTEIEKEKEEAEKKKSKKTT
ncbi:proteasome subunit alpha-type 8 isoform X1 [Vulpes vulpes]|uniref:Proteasome subunit alpha-type 8 isoform X1 n=1 Tax=Vulpes vulpes TaxID=9627 RepID=A0A3Q7T1X9_VULVU